MNFALANAQKQLEKLRSQHGVDYRPTLSVGGGFAAAPVRDVATAEAVQPGSPPVAQLSHHGDIAIAALRSGESVHYQLWLVMRLLDVQGSGCLAVGVAREQLTQEGAATFLYQWPRLKQLLMEGDGKYWRLDDGVKGRVFIRREASIAALLGISRLRGCHVVIEQPEVLCRVQLFRAHCFAAWMANRIRPISQATIERMTGITPRTQLRYCRLANIDTISNIAIGPRYGADVAEECAWQHGGSFKFKDYRGKQGPAGQEYVAWHLPTSYSNGAAHGSKRQRKRTNNYLAGLRTNRDAGNDQIAAIFFGNGALAARAADRQVSGDVGLVQEFYWPGLRSRSKDVQLWHSMAV